MAIDITKIRLTEFIPTEFSVRGTITSQQLAQEGITAQFQVSQEVDFVTTLIQNRIGVHLRVTVETVVGEPPEPTGSGGTFALAFGFIIDNLPDLLVTATAEEGSGQHPPLPLLTLLTSIAYSTARGVLWTRLAGTALEGFTLPIVDINQLLLQLAHNKGNRRTD